MVNSSQSLPKVPEILWGRRPGSSNDMAPYFSYYQRQWEEFSAAKGTNGAFTTFNDFSNVVEQIKNGASPDNIIAKLQETHQAEEYPAQTLHDLVDLAVRTLTMVHISKNEENDSAWTDGSLRLFLDNKFPNTPTLDCESIIFPKSFDAYDVENIGGILIEFTDNLADHLRLVRNGGAVLIFHHVSFLEFLDSDASDPQLVPAELVKETLRTLSMLFPKSELSSFVGIKSSEGKWLRAACNTWESKPSTGGAKVDPALFRCASLPLGGRRIKGFHYWRDRLVLLKQRCDDQTVPGKASKTGLALTVAAAQSVWGGGVV